MLVLYAGSQVLRGGRISMPTIHNTGNNPFRMPAILAEADRDVWLHGTPEEARAVLKPYPAEMMVHYEVTTRVNSPRNNDEELIEPVGDPDQRGAVDEGDDG